MTDDIPEGYVPSAEDFAELALEMERDREKHDLFLVDGRLTRGRVINGVFTPRDRGALQDQAEEDQDKLGGHGWQMLHPKKEDE